MGRRTHCLRASHRASLSVLSEVEVHEFRLGSRAASIVGMAQQLLERGGMDEETTLRVRAIRDLALDALREAEEKPE